MADQITSTKATEYFVMAKLYHSLAKKLLLFYFHSSFTHHLERQKVRRTAYLKVYLKVHLKVYLKVGLFSRRRNERMELVKCK